MASETIQKWADNAMLKLVHQLITIVVGAAVTVALPMALVWGSSVNKKLSELEANMADRDRVTRLEEGRAQQRRDTERLIATMETLADRLTVRETNAFTNVDGARLEQRIDDQNEQVREILDTRLQAIERRLERIEAQP